MARKVAALLGVLAGCSGIAIVAAQRAAPEERAQQVIFEEPFEDADWALRGWYDDPRMELSSEEHLPTGTHSCVWHWARKGDVHPVGRGARVHLPPVTDVTLSFSIKHSGNWAWTGVPYHPHEFHFVTNVDSEYVGPAWTHLTFYVEVVNGRPRVAIQDGANIDVSRVEQDLVGVTERRAVAGGNGDSDGHGPGDCYRVGDKYANGKFWETDGIYFAEERGPRYKGDWHRVQARFRLNTVKGGIGQRDGVIQYWYDGELLMDYHDVVFRTGQYPDMKINQFLMTPYFGPGVPHEQSIWVDDLRITTPLDATAP